MKAKSLILPLSLLLGTALYGQSAACGDPGYVDSLIRHYLTSPDGPLHGNYNDPRWGRYADSVLLVCPNAAEAYQLKAIPALKSGDYETAFRLNKKAAELDSAHYLDYLAFLKCIFTKDYSGALADFNLCITRNPTGGLMDHSYRFFAALCQMEMGNYIEAEQSFLQDIAMQKEGNAERTPHFNSSFYTGLNYFRMGDLAKAKQFFNQTVTGYEQHPEANYYLGLVAQEERNGQLAQHYFAIARRALKTGYRMNEDNIYYANYPGQVTVYEIDKVQQP